MEKCYLKIIAVNYQLLQSQRGKATKCWHSFVCIIIIFYLSTLRNETEFLIDLYSVSNGMIAENFIKINSRDSEPILDKLWDGVVNITLIKKLLKVHKWNLQAW